MKIFESCGKFYVFALTVKSHFNSRTIWLRGAWHIRILAFYNTLFLVITICTWHRVAFLVTIVVVIILIIYLSWLWNYDYYNMTFAIFVYTFHWKLRSKSMYLLFQPSFFPNVRESLFYLLLLSYKDPAQFSF